MRPFFAEGRLPKRAETACLADARGEGTRAPGRVLGHETERQTARMMQGSRFRAMGARACA
eukprot:7302252-Lingulodinium_polyedra.AAC.1